MLYALVVSLDIYGGYTGWSSNIQTVTESWAAAQ
jgi:hypothetical protein